MPDTRDPELRVHQGAPTISTATVTVGDEQLIVTVVRSEDSVNVYAQPVSPDQLRMASGCEGAREYHGTIYCNDRLCDRCNALRRDNGDA